MTADDVAGTTGIAPMDPHLSSERLAALADEPVTTDEDRHLTACRLCSEEVASYRSLLELARAEHDRLDKPVSAWGPVAAALAEEGLLATPRRVRPSGSSVAASWARQAAAAVVFLAGGVAVGRLSIRSDSPTAATRVAKIQQNSATNETGTRLVSDTNAPFASKMDALTSLLNAENEYRHAAAYLMVVDSANGAQSGGNPIRTRLAALDEVAQTTRAALYAAPEDPVLKQYYLSSIGAREATLRELGRGLPKNVRLSRY
jgi:hypothetical protein